MKHRFLSLAGAACTATLVVSTVLSASGAHARALGTSQNLPYKGGAVMHHPSVYPIFWLPAGYHYHAPGSTLTDDDYAGIITQYLSDLSGSSLYGLAGQYRDKKGPIESEFDTADAVLDDTPYPGGRGAPGNALTRDDIRLEILRVIADQGITNTYDQSEYIVYTGYNVNYCSSSDYCSYRPGSKGFCGIHSYFKQRGKYYLYSVIGDLPVTCHRVTRQLTDDSAPNSDKQADIAANTTSHEIFESATDPFFNAWAASSTEEISDKCSENFGTIADDGGNVVLNGNSYLNQSEWSNRAGGCAFG